MNSEKMPHVDRAVGAPKDKQQALEEAIAKVYEKKGNTKIEGVEVEKSSRDLEIIDFVSNAVSEYQKHYGRKKEISVPMNKVHVLEDGGTEKYTDGRYSVGAHASIYGSVIVDRRESDIDFAVTIFHELFHLKSYKALQITKTEKPEDAQLKSYRAGIAIISRDGETVYFEDLEEAITTVMTERFYNEYIQNSDLFMQEGGIKSPEFSRSREKVKLEKLVEELWQKNQNQFLSKEEVMDLFIDAQVNGNLLNIGRLIEKSFGKGSFRKLGKDEFRDN